MKITIKTDTGILHVNGTVVNVEEPCKPTCKICENFIQHYGRDTNGTYFPVNYGHCKVGHGPKGVKPTKPACEKYKPKSEQKEADEKLEHFVQTLVTQIQEFNWRN